MMSCVVARLSVFNCVPGAFPRTYFTCCARRHFVGVQYFSTKVNLPPPLFSSDHNGTENNLSSNSFEEMAPPDGPRCGTKGSNSIKKAHKFQEGTYISARFTARRPTSPWEKNRKGISQADRGNTEEFNNLRDDDFEVERKRSPKLPVTPTISEGSEILFGVAPCHLAISQFRRKFVNLFLKSTLKPRSPKILEILSQAEAHGVPVQYVKGKVLNFLCNNHVHQGVCMEVTPLQCKRLDKDTEDLAEHDGMCLEKQQLWLALEGIQDPMNMGAILRTAYFLGVEKVVKNQTNSCPLTPVVSKASAGTMEVLETFETDNLLEFLQVKSQQGWQILGTVGNANTIQHIPVTTTAEFEWRKPVILVLGNEGKGLSTEIRSLCHIMLTVPSGRNLPTGIESLNVSVAAGIILHNLCLKRTQ